MSDWSWLGASWDLLGRDMALIGGFQSPLLSWIGAGGILLLCLWPECLAADIGVEVRRALKPLLESTRDLTIPSTSNAILHRSPMRRRTRCSIV